MEEALGAIRQVLSERQADTAELEAGASGSTTAEPGPSEENSGARATAEAGLLSREATAAVFSSVSRLTENVKKHEPTLEDFVCEALRPMLKSWLDENLPDVVERMVQAEVQRVIRTR
jgi:cell pole-organizing protein PopZ